MSKTALLVGGTAATGREIIAELQSQGYSVTLYNRGRFNHTLDAAGLEILVGDPHFRETIASDLKGREWDVTIATYGRTRYLAEALAGRTGHFLAISGTPVCRTGYGLPMMEHDPVASVETAPANMADIVPRIAQTEAEILAIGQSGEFAATIVRYPYVYGPHSLVPMEWHVIKRVLDGRRRWPLIDSGLQVTGRCASRNAAALLSAAIGQRDSADGQIFHAGDERQFSQREWIETIAGLMDYRFEFVDIPSGVAPTGTSAIPMTAEYLFSQSRADVAKGLIRHNTTLPLKAIRRLGYSERVDPLTWMRQTVEYWLENPFEVPLSDTPPLGAADFDYPAEDALLHWWKETLAAAPCFGQPIRRGHPYDHPAKPG